MDAPVLGPDVKLRRSPAALAEEVGGATLVLDPVADRYTRLTGVGGALFARLAEPATPAELAAGLQASHAVEADRALADVLAFVEDLLARGLVEPV